MLNYYTSLPENKTNKQSKFTYFTDIQKKKNTISKQNTEHLFVAISGVNNKNSVTINTIKTSPLTKDNHHKPNYHYPTNTSIKNNFYTPYLGNIKFNFTYGAENYYTDNKTPINRLATYLSAEYNYLLYVLQDSITENLNSQLLATNQGFYAQSGSPGVEYFYYRSMAGTCPGCVVEGGDFSLRGGVSFPSGDGPVNNEQGFPLVASSCAELEQEIANMLASYGDTSMELGYPIDWNITYKDGTAVSGSGCADVPADFADASSQSFAGLSGPECSILAAKYSGLNINFNMYDTELVISSIIPDSPVGEPCSDLYGRSV
jgi:hypothetical protein